jgi:hypothetical protein
MNYKIIVCPILKEGVKNGGGTIVYGQKEKECYNLEKGTNTLGYFVSVSFPTGVDCGCSTALLTVNGL